MKKGELKHAVYKYLDSIKNPQIIGGWAIADHMASITGYCAYPNVILKICKEWAFHSCGSFDCIDRERSIYSFKPGREVCGTKLEQLPVGSHVKLYAAIRKI